MKSWRNVAFLGFLLLALGAIASWDEWQTKKDQEAEKARNRLTLLQPDEIDELRYLSSRKKEDSQETIEAASSSHVDSDKPLDITMVKKNGHWQIISPIDYPADKSTIDSVVKTVTDYAYTQEIPVSREKWADFGLEHPQQAVTLKSTSNPKQGMTVFIGGKAPVGYNVYFRTSDSEKVFMGSQHLLVSTNKTLFDFRDKKVLNLDEKSITSMRYERIGLPAIQVVKINGAYTITQPEHADADEAEIKDFVAALNSLKAEGIEDKPQGELLSALQKAEIKVTWAETSGGEKTIQFSTFKDKFYASLESAVTAFAIPNEASQKLKRDVLSFRNRRILSTDLLNVKTIEIDGSLYENHNGSWYSTTEAAKLKEQKTAENAKEQPKEEAHIRALMVDLEFAKTDKFYPPKSDDITSNLQTAPLHRIKVGYVEEKKAPLVIELFASSETDKYLVRRSDKSTIYRVPRSSFYSMTPGSHGQEGKFPAPSTVDDLPVDDSDDPSLNVASPSGNQAG